MGWFVGWCDLAALYSGHGRKIQNGCVYLLPIGTQTAGPNGLNFGMGMWMDCGTVCEGDQVLPLWWVW